MKSMFMWDEDGRRRNEDGRHDNDLWCLLFVERLLECRKLLFLQNQPVPGGI